MHELSICQALITKVVEIAEARGMAPRRVEIAVGPLSGAEAALLERAYPLACAGTCAEGSHLVVNEAPIRVRCRACGNENAARVNDLRCGRCGSWQTDLLSGDELILTSVELGPAAGPAGQPARTPEAASNIPYGDTPYGGDHV